VLEGVRAGQTNAEIAVRLGLSPDTVKYHVSNMLGKLGVERREELAAWKPEPERRRGRRWLLAPLALPLAVGVGLALVFAFAAEDNSDALDDCPAERSLCEFAAEVEETLAARDWERVLSLMRQREGTCGGSPGEVDTACEDMEQGSSVSGYVVGRSFQFLTREQALAVLPESIGESADAQDDFGPGRVRLYSMSKGFLEQCESCWSLVFSLVRELPGLPTPDQTMALRRDIVLAEVDRSDGEWRVSAITDGPLVSDGTEGILLGERRLFDAEFTLWNPKDGREPAGPGGFWFGGPVAYEGEDCLPLREVPGGVVPLACLEQGEEAYVFAAFADWWLLRADSGPEVLMGWAPAAQLRKPPLSPAGADACHLLAAPARPLTSFPGTQHFREATASSGDVTVQASASRTPSETAVDYMVEGDMLEVGWPVIVLGNGTELVATRVETVDGMRRAYFPTIVPSDPVVVIFGPFVEADLAAQVDVCAALASAGHELGAEGRLSVLDEHVTGRQDLVKELEFGGSGGDWWLQLVVSGNLTGDSVDVTLYNREANPLEDQGRAGPLTTLLSGETVGATELTFGYTTAKVLTTVTLVVGSAELEGPVEIEFVMR
jgi:hypothetical protein